MVFIADLNNLLIKKCNIVIIGSFIFRVYFFIYILGFLLKSYYYIWVFN